MPPGPSISRFRRLPVCSQKQCLRRRLGDTLRAANQVLLLEDAGELGRRQGEVEWLHQQGARMCGEGLECEDSHKRVLRQ